MKKILFLILIICSTTVSSQMTVSTITPTFKGSGGLSLDNEGNLYIGDFGDFLGMADPDGLPNDVLKLDTNLNLTQFSTGFVGASGNGFDSNGILYQSDIRDNAIYKIIGGVRTFVTSTGISSPVGIVFDSNDNFYVCNCGDGTIRKVTPAGDSTLFASGTIFACPNGITVDENDNLYVSNFSNTNIVKITPAGVTSVIGNTPANNGHLDYNRSLRTLFIASYFGHQIFYIVLDNPEVRLLAGTGLRGNADGPAASATFSTPNGIAVSEDGNSLYVNCAVPLNGPEINPQVIRLISDIIILDTEEQAQHSPQVKISPNPASDTFTIEADFPWNKSAVSIIVYDLLGHQVQELNNITPIESNFKQEIDISNLADGTYLFRVMSGTQELFNGKVIKK